PEGLKPVYLQVEGTLPEVPETKLEGEIEGRFVVGEGAYRVEVLVQDDAGRVCRNSWQIQARRAGSERELTPASPAGAVEELIPPPRQAASAPHRIQRLTLLVHAAPLSARSSVLQDGDMARIMGSLSAVVEQLPAWDVRLVVFNLAQN